MKLIKLVLLSAILANFFASTNYLHAQGNIDLNDSLKIEISQVKKEIEGIKNLKITGMVQMQFQIAESKGTKSFDGGDFLANQYNRFMIRRGRVKLTYNQKHSQYVMQINGSERGVNLVEIFGKVTDPWKKTFSLTAGILNRPFGFEIQQSSSDRETPERSRFTQVLLPNERDLGAMLTIATPKDKKLHGLKIDAGFFNGNGIAAPGTTSLNNSALVDIDNFKDFIAHVHYKKSLKEGKFDFGIGASHYRGKLAYQSNKAYNRIEDLQGVKTWILSDTLKTTIGKKTPRIYSAVEFQMSIRSKIGKTSLRGEFIFGKQSGTMDENKSPGSLPVQLDTYFRNFNGGNLYLIQRIGTTKHELAVKYDWYDPNTKLSQADFVMGTNMSKAEIKFQMLGFGYLYYWDENVKFMVYYNLVQNEKGEGIANYHSDLKDNVLTFRMQYRF